MSQAGHGPFPMSCLLKCLLPRLSCPWSPGSKWLAVEEWVTAGTFKVTPREPPALYTTYSPMSTPHTGARATHARMQLGASFLTLFCPSSLSSSCSTCPGSVQRQRLCWLAETAFPTGADCLSLCPPNCRVVQAFLSQENTCPPSPGHRPSPAEPHVPLFMRGRLGQAPQAGRGGRH